MSTKKINLAELICQAIAIVLLFIPGIFNWEHWNTVDWGVSELSLRMPITFIHTASNTNAFLGYLTAAIMFINLALLILFIYKDIPHKVEKFYRILPTASIILMVVFALLAGIQDDYGYCATVNWLFYVDMLFLAATTVLAFMRYSSKVKKEIPAKVTIVPASNADELAKYKELFDGGVITQEEFEAKKGQLLDL